MRIKAHRCNFFEPEWEDSIESLKVTGSTKKATWWTNRAPNRMKDGSRSFWLRALAVTHPSVSSPSPAGQLVPPTLVIADAAEEVTRWQLRDPLTGDRFWAVTLTSLWIQGEDAEWDLHNCGVKLWAHILSLNFHNYSETTWFINSLYFYCYSTRHRYQDLLIYTLILHVYYPVVFLLVLFWCDCEKQLD